MTKTTYIATAPDGSELTRKTDRTYTHAVLLEGKEGWKAEGFCGRLDLAHKKQLEHPGSIVVEVKALGDAQTDKPKAEATEDAEPTKDETVGRPEEEPSVDEKIRNAKVTGPERKGKIGDLVHELLMDETLDYVTIVDRVMAKFPDAKTTARSVASVAAVLRKKGAEVPKRRKSKV
ncbi:hypothetical protein TG4357_02465 [Thalassovita gelatinovora]|uniref:Uncharacterized protein n=1 Tax=Thalassovita gelatinovora TaxID=53501 RepID=A0A0P1FEK0_THAGE|nr:hypothetical protein [Thalassovita gelatinovora]QIZ79608.1 hypothetical protein HFZ77_03485 [Thalassovita gelatinovora]CUH66527.1 hypothetical protein TG4357_02465 [Thalassovita gelatinovora]SEQ37370.1 hypothetical protein SAMN04488043_1051 [Thalassovita gelatinovora]